MEEIKINSGSGIYYDRPNRKPRRQEPRRTGRRRADSNTLGKKLVKDELEREKQTNERNQPNGKTRKKTKAVAANRDAAREHSGDR